MTHSVLKVPHSRIASVLLPRIVVRTFSSGQSVSSSLASAAALHLFRTDITSGFIIITSGNQSRFPSGSQSPLRPSAVFQRHPLKPFARFSSRSALSVMEQQPVDHHAASRLVADDLEKPLQDNRQYRVIRLRNELEALIIHDPDTDKASAALDNGAGGFSDDPSLPGMAHAVEHLLFMGTEKVCAREPVPMWRILTFA